MTALSIVEGTRRKNNNPKIWIPDKFQYYKTSLSIGELDIVKKLEFS
jgi:hypothetical protein